MDACKLTWSRIASRRDAEGGFICSAEKPYDSVKPILVPIQKGGFRVETGREISNNEFCYFPAVGSGQDEAIESTAAHFTNGQNAAVGSMEQCFVLGVVVITILI